MYGFGCGVAGVSVRGAGDLRCLHALIAANYPLSLSHSSLPLLLFCFHERLPGKMEILRGNVDRIESISRLVLPSCRQHASILSY